MDKTARHNQQHIALLIHTLAGGGLERVMMNLATEFCARGFRVDLLVGRKIGQMRELVPAAVRVVTLPVSTRLAAHARIVAADPGGLGKVMPILLDRKAHWIWKSLPALVAYLREAHPHALMSGYTPVNLAALWARRLSGVPTRLLVSEHTTLSEQLKRTRTWYKHAYPGQIRRTYPWADAIVAVSKGVAQDLSEQTGLARERITTIHNPLDPKVVADAQAPLAHSWLAPGAPPVVISAGRLVDQKDFPLLLKAFARLRKIRSARLIILGEGKQRAALEALAAELRIAADVELPGWVSNPHAYIARASVFVLSSAWEGFGNILLEAMACGCPVVSTDCPHGPAEILRNGQFGRLVPVGDDAALADAILNTLEAPLETGRLKSRAAEFSIGKVVDRYLALLLGTTDFLTHDSERGLDCATAPPSGG
jgi:glycosyltransferase involved in cell wall biosynthesis